MRARVVAVGGWVYVRALTRSCSLFEFTVRVPRVPLRITCTHRRARARDQGEIARAYSVELSCMMRSGRPSVNRDLLTMTYRLR